MNPQRYIMPVIIAASIHTALVFLFSGKPPVVRLPPEKPVVLPDLPRIAITPEETPAEATGDNGGVAELPPSIPDLPRELTKEDIFHIDVREPVESIKPVADLPRIPEGLPGPGDGKEIGNGVRGVITAGMLDRAPRATVQPPPGYPAAMRSSSISGSVTVEFVVDTTGRVIAAEAVKWTHREFADPAVRAVLRWRFEPGTVNGRKVNFRMAVPIEFNAER